MSKVKKSTIFLSIFALIIGLVGGFYGFSYLKLPLTDSIEVNEEYFYHNNQSQVANFSEFDGEISVHFLELGNKYTGDCTYIKTAEADILIDCGSKTSSVGYVADYLNNYVTDGILEYVIVTHAHTDHYAGFATSEKTDSIFDLFECKNIIDFGTNTNQNPNGKTYKNYLREREAEITAGATYYTANQCVGNPFEIGEGITLEILNSYYYTHTASSENDYSVCTLISTQHKNFLFTGDLEEKGEEELIKLNNLPKIDLYKAGHHGSKTSSTSALMTAIEPKVVCVCCCAGSSEYTTVAENQFPTQEFINNVAPHTSEIYVTTLCLDYKNNQFASFNGNIVYACKQEVYQVFCSNNTTLLKDSEWFSKNRIWPNGA